MWDVIKAIDTLVADDYDSIINGSYGEMLESILIHGFKGYSNYTDEELMNELMERDISTVFGDNDD